VAPTETQGEPSQAPEQTDQKNGSETDGDLRRLQRGLRNLAFTLERDRKSSQAELSRVRATLDELNERLDAAAGGQQAPAPEPPNATTNGTSGPEMAERSEAAQAAEVAERTDAAEPAEASDLKALRRQVAELHRQVAEVRQLELARTRRRRLFRRRRPTTTITHTPVSEPQAAARAPQRPSRVRRVARRIARLPRRARLRTLRLARRTKAVIRARLFARRLGSLSHHAPKELKIPRRYFRQIKVDSPPTISIVTPSFNQGRFLDDTIRSVVEQEYPRLEYIVQDGGSTDETEEVLSRHADRLHHHEMRSDDGQADAINLGFRHATGDVMAYLNSDDMLLPGALHYVARYFRRHPQVDVVYGHRILVDEDNMEIGRWILPRHNDEVLSWADFIPQETMFWRRRIWEKSGAAMDKSWFLVLDWDLLLRFREADARMVRLPRFLGAFRIHDVQKTSSVMDSHGKEEMAALRKRCLGREVTRPEISKGVGPYLRRHHVLQKLYRARMLRY
jgi:glycosyltransferase involved in cell wall biosynthesis